MSISAIQLNWTPVFFSPESVYAILKSIYSVLAETTEPGKLFQAEIILFVTAHVQ